MSAERTLEIANILKERSSFQNKLSITNIINILEDKGYKASRNTIRNDIEILINKGFNIHKSRGRSNVTLYYIEGEISFEESRVILDMIYSNKFLSNIKKEIITDKILSNIYIGQGNKIKSKIRTETINTGDIDVIDNILKLHEAIDKRKTISFTTVSRNIYKEIVEKKKVKTFIPKEIYYHNSRYYLIGYNDKEEIRHYRIDRIYNILLGEVHNNYRKIDLRYYSIKNFDMFGCNDVERIELKIRNELINSVIELYGDKVNIHKCFDDNDYFILSVEVGINKGLIRWILKQGSDIEVIYPTKLIKEIVNEINKMLNNYK